MVNGKRLYDLQPLIKALENGQDWIQRVIAKQAEAEKEKRIRIIVAEGESLAAQKMLEAAQKYSQNPISLKLRELQTMAEIAREKNLVVITNTSNVNDLGKHFALSKTVEK